MGIRTMIIQGTFSDYHAFDSYYTQGPCYGQCFTGGSNDRLHLDAYSGHPTSFGLFYWPTTDGYTLAGPESTTDSYCKEAIGSLQRAIIIDIFTGGDNENYYSELSNIRVEDGFANFFK